MLLLDSLLAALGAGPAHLAHARRVWLAGLPLAGHVDRPRLPFPAGVLAELPAVDAALDELLAVERAEPAADGTKFLGRLGDGQAIESVLLPGGSLCVSSQVGCAVGCGFCWTGTLGLLRQLTADEILAQVAAARRGGASVRRVLFMGMGEPAHNLAAVLEAIARLGLEGCIGHKDLVFSSVGEPAVFARLLENQVKPALALSLHSTDDEKRQALLPRAPKIPARELLEAALDYGRASGHPLQIQWTLLAGINDGEDELRRLIGWLRGRRAVVDFISYNPVEGLDYSRVGRERTLEMTRALHAEGILAKLRDSGAQDVHGGCGQLHARTQ